MCGSCDYAARTENKTQNHTEIKHCAPVTVQASWATILCTDLCRTGMPPDYAGKTHHIKLKIQMFFSLVKMICAALHT